MYGQRTTFERPVLFPGPLNLRTLELIAGQAQDGAFARAIAGVSTDAYCVLHCPAGVPLVSLSKTEAGTAAEIAPCILLVGDEILDLTKDSVDARRRLLPPAGRSGAAILTLKVEREAVVLDAGDGSGERHSERQIWSLGYDEDGAPLAGLKITPITMKLDKASLAPGLRLGSIEDRAFEIADHLEPLFELSRSIRVAVANGSAPLTLATMRLANLKQTLLDVLMTASALSTETYARIGGHLEALGADLGLEWNALDSARAEELHALAEVFPIDALVVGAHDILSSSPQAGAELSFEAHVVSIDPTGRSIIEAELPSTLSDLIGASTEKLLIEVEGLQTREGITAAVHPTMRPEQLPAALSHLPIFSTETSFQVSLPLKAGKWPGEKKAFSELNRAKRLRMHVPLTGTHEGLSTPIIHITRIPT